METKMETKMETLEKFIMDKSVVIETPKDTIIDGIIVDVFKTTWREIIDPEKIIKFDNPDEEIIKIKYECEYKNHFLKNDETYRFYEKPMCNSKLGSFLIKYDKLTIGITIKIIFDGKGLPSIKLD